MSNAIIKIEGASFVRIEDIAQVYRVHSAWLVDVYDRGLLGRGHVHGSSILIAAVQIDRVATIVRMHEILELDLDTIELQLAHDIE